jgi:creatinine amidohydrolase
MRTDKVTYADIEDYLTLEDTVIVPIGAVEQYGPHLATGTELRICEEMATAVGEATGLAVTPIVPINYSVMFVDYPGTLTVDMSTVESYVGQFCHGLASQGFRRFFFVNIHAGSLGPLESVSRSLRTEWDAFGGLIDVFSIMRDVGGITYETKNAPTGHASEMVTSVALHLCPELVFMDRVQPAPNLGGFVDGVRTVSSGKVAMGKSNFSVFSNIRDYTPMGMQGDAMGATKDKGKAVWDESLGYISEAARKFSKMNLGSDS